MDDQHQVGAIDRPTGLGPEAIGWLILVGVSLASFSGLFVLLGFMLFVVPGLVLLAGPNLLLYGGALRLGLWSWRRRKAPLVRLAVVGLVALIAVGAPWVVNRRLDAETRVLTAEDFDTLAPERSRPRTIRLIPANDCDLTCMTLLSRGLADRVVLQDRIYGWSATPACRKAKPSVQDAGICLRHEMGPAPSIDLTLRVTSPHGLQRRWTTAMRLNPLASGPRTVDVLEAWPCAGPEGCKPVVRRTYIKQAYLRAPLWLYVDGVSGTRFLRAWAREERGVRADPVAFVAGKWSPAP
ncbi:hypothetical protein [Caulobacter segnis]